MDNFGLMENPKMASRGQVELSSAKQLVAQM